MSPNPPRRERLESTAFLALALYLTATAADALHRGHWLYTDYLGLPVPAPLAAVAGLLALVAAFRRGPRSR